MADYFTDSTRWNLLQGCSKVSAGCKHCWAEKMAVRHRNASTRNGRWSGEVVTFPERLGQPLHWRKPRVVATQFMGDLFYERVPFEFIAAIYGVMAACPSHTFLVLTKRPERMLEFYRWLPEHRGTGIPWGGLEFAREYPIEESWPDDAVIPAWNARSFAEPLVGQRLDISEATWPLQNMWVGISAENQETLDARWQTLAEVPTAKHWLSLEPLLGPIEIKCRGCGQDGEAHLAPDQGGCSGWFPDLIVAGGESGPGARPCDIDWLRSIKRQCAEAGVPVHIKQLGAKPYEQRPTPTGEGFDPSDVLAGGLDRDVHRRWWAKEGWTLVKTPTGSSMYRYPKTTDSKGAVVSDWPPDLQLDSRQWPEVSR